MLLPRLKLRAARRSLLTASRARRASGGASHPPALHLPSPCHCPNARGPESPEEAGRAVGPQLQAKGTRLHLQVRGSPTDTSVRAPNATPEASGDLTRPQQAHAPAETALRPSRERVPGGTSFPSAVFLSPPPECSRGFLRGAGALDVAGPGQPGCRAWGALLGLSAAGPPRHLQAPDRPRPFPGRRRRPE